jgi:hypothetical protein
VVGGRHQIGHFRASGDFDHDGQPLERAFAVALGIAGKRIGLGPDQIGILAVDRAGLVPVGAGELAFGQRLPGRRCGL